MQIWAIYKQYDNASGILINAIRINNDQDYFCFIG
ncbi:hypothetical protein SAMN05428947_108134 [Mucilaginibacter sp. OK283]|nr:hypothetical protein SAMN05428947_108134 [Mucilaginibacter sp. OK283]